MKTADLSGPYLDYFVAKVLHMDARISVDAHGEPVCIVGGVIGHPFRPSTDWATGGPLIQANRIAVYPDAHRWRAYRYKNYAGDTALQAVMRALVAGKFGEEVRDEGF
jgi:hypothetical protein